MELGFAGNFPDEHSKDAWYYDEEDMLDMDAFEERDQDSDYDYEESYSSKRKRRRGPRGGGHHPARSHPPATDSPGPKRTKVIGFCCFTIEFTLRMYYTFRWFSRFFRILENY